MHTIGQDGDGTWCVMRGVIVSDGTDTHTELQVMFKRLSLGSALRICNVLSGGESVPSADVINVWGMCAHG